MNPKPNFAPFSFSSDALPAGAPNPFMAPAVAFEDELVARPVDAVWSQDAGDCEEADLPGPEAIDVRILWGTNVLHFEQMCPPRAFTLGGVGSDFTLPELGSSPASGACPLVILRDDRASVFVAAGATAEVRLVNGTTASLVQCLERGTAQPSADESGAFEIALPHGATATLKLPGSDLVFEVSRARARQQPDTGFLAGADLSGQIYTGLSALVHATLVGALAFFLPAMHGDDAESIDRNTAAAMRPYLQAIAEREEEQQNVVSEAGPAVAAGGGSGSQAQGPSGALGSTVSRPVTPGRYAIQGDAADAKLARARAIEEATTFGMLNILSGTTTDTPIAAWGEDAARGRDASNANGGMWAESIGDAFGTGGLSMSGTEEGGGGKWNGIGINGIGSTIGHGSGLMGDLGPGHGYGPPGWGIGHAGPGGGHTPKGPQLREPPIETFNGTLPREVVQRVVRQNFGRFRLCYEGGLRTNPGLTGRVAVAFVIARDGSVAVASADRSTEMPDQNVVSCVVRGFQNLSFPAPTNGTVQVIYPLMLAPGGD